MDYRLFDQARIGWSREALVVTTAEGACGAVLGRDAGELLGQPVAAVLGVPPEIAQELSHKAIGEAPPAEFVQSRTARPARWLRLALGLLDGQPAAAVTDVDRLLEGAPPFQIHRLSSSLSHEIRNPLSSVKMAVQTVAKNEALTDRDRRRLAIANREIRTLERMLSLLSEYGRRASPQADLVPIRVLLQEALALVEPELTERHIAVPLDRVDLAARVRADSSPFALVLAQLLLNVAMGLPEGSSVEVQAAQEEERWLLSVRDPTAVLKPEEEKTVFEPFGSMLARGAGLSLATLRQVMVNHGGTVSAQASPAGGTTYTLRFSA